MQECFYLACAYRAHGSFSQLALDEHIQSSFWFQIARLCFAWHLVLKFFFINWLFCRSANCTSVICQVLKKVLFKVELWLVVDQRVPMIEHSSEMISYLTIFWSIFLHCLCFAHDFSSLALGINEPALQNESLEWINYFVRGIAKLAKIILKYSCGNSVKTTGAKFCTMTFREKSIIGRVVFLIK